MGKVFIAILLSSLVTLLFSNPSIAVTAMVQGSHDALTLALNLTALYAFWLGLFAIIEKIGLADILARALKPVVKFLFPESSKTTEKYVTMNMAANMLGLGNASTPMAISAIGSMDKGSEKATDNMIMLVVISCTSLQLLPSTVIGLRASYGSTNPTDFLLAGFVATVTSTAIGIILVKIYTKIKNRIKK